MMNMMKYLRYRMMMLRMNTTDETLAEDDDAEDEYNEIPLAEDDDAEDVAEKPQRCQWESRHAGHPEGEGLQYSAHSDHGWLAGSLNGLNRC